MYHRVHTDLVVCNDESAALSRAGNIAVSLMLKLMTALWPFGYQRDFVWTEWT